MTAAEYVQRLLPAWAQGTELGRLVAACAANVDTLRAAVLTLRRTWVLGSAPDDALDVHGEARTAPRWDEETPEAYRRRLMGLFETRQKQSTKPGMLALMEALGQPDARVHELYNDHDVQTYDGTWAFDGQRVFDSPNRWAEFAIYLPWGAAAFSAATFVRWLREVNRIKPAHTVLASFRLELPTSDEWSGTFGDNATVQSTWQERYDGSWTFDGAVPFGPIVEVFDA